MKKSRTVAERSHLDKLVEIGCIVCGWPACAHHIRDGQGIHHRGTKRWQKIYGDERTLLARALRRISE